MGRPVSEERDGDFLGVNEKGEVQHRGSSSGIQLLHRRHPSGVSASSQNSPLAAQASPRSSASGESRDRAPSASGLASGSVLALPLVRSSSHSHSHSSGAGAASPAPSRSPELERNSFNVHPASLSNGAQAHREHILNTLSPHGTPRSNARSLNDTASGRWSSPLKSGNVSLPPVSPVPAESETESAQLRSTLQNVRRQSLTFAEAGLGTDPPVSERANARLWKCYFSGVHPAWPLLYKVSCLLTRVYCAELQLTFCLLRSLLLTRFQSQNCQIDSIPSCCMPYMRSLHALAARSKLAHLQRVQRL